MSSGPFGTFIGSFCSCGMLPGSFPSRGHRSDRSAGRWHRFVLHRSNTVQPVCTVHCATREVGRKLLCGCDVWAGRGNEIWLLWFFSVIWQWYRLKSQLYRLLLFQIFIEIKYHRTNMTIKNKVVIDTSHLFNYSYI